MPTAMTTTAGQAILNTALFEALFVNDIRQLGPAIAAAKQTLLANGDSYYEQISATFLLLGDPALTLKIPLPRMPGGVAAFKQNNKVRIRWNAALDCNGNAVAGYNIYRASSPAGPYSKINPALVTATEYVDSTGAVGSNEAGGGSGSYYAVSSVDSAGDESAQSLGISPSALASAIGGGGAGGGCFVDTVAQPVSGQGFLWVLLAIIGMAVTVRRKANRFQREKMFFASLWLKRTSHGSRRTTHDEKRQLMGVQRGRLGVHSGHICAGFSRPTG
jgi:hypothetical protein